MHSQGSSAKDTGTKRSLSTIVSQSYSSRFADAVAEFVIRENLPLHFVESPNLHLFLEQIIPAKDFSKLVIIDRKRLKELILEKNQLIRGRLGELLSGEKCSFTVDAWSNRNGASFLGMTAHWINDAFELKSTTFWFSELTGKGLCLYFSFFPPSFSFFPPLKEAVLLLLHDVFSTL